MTRIIKNLIVYILVIALVFSLVGCSSDYAEPEANPTPEMEFPEGEMPFGEMGGMPEVEATTDPTVTTAPASGSDVVVKDVISDAYGVYLYTYTSTYTSTPSNYVIIRTDDDELLSKDLVITEIDLASYSGDADIDDEDIIPDLGDGIAINATTMKLYWGATATEGYSVDYLVALARDDEGDYYEVEYVVSGSSGYWQEVGGSQLSDDEEIYIGLPLSDSGTYEVDVTFEIKDSEDAYQYGYFEKEIEDGITFTLTGSSKIAKAKADVYVKSEAIRIVTTDDEDNTIADDDKDNIEYQMDSDYILIGSSDSNVADLLSSYITIEVDGETDTNALSEFVKLVDIDDVYAYVYYEDIIYKTSSGSTDKYLVLSEQSDLNGSSADEDDWIEDGDLVWVNYEFTIYDGGRYVISALNALSVETVVDNILDISYVDGDNDFKDGSVGDYENSDLIEQAMSTYEDLSTAQKAYLESFTYNNLTDQYEDEDGNEKDVYSTSYFFAWCDDEGLTAGTYSGYDLVDYLEAAEDFLEELEIVSAFETVLDNYDLWENGNTQSFTSVDDLRTYVAVVSDDDDVLGLTNMVDFNSGSTTMVDNLEVVLLYLDEMSDDDRDIIQARATVTYDYLEYCESLIVTDDVEYVMAEISAVVASYLVSDLTNTLLYVDLESDGNNGYQSVIGLDATHMVYSTSLFSSISRALQSYEELAPEKQELLESWTLTLISPTENISLHDNINYFNADIITTGSGSFTITYSNAIYALSEMMEVTQNLNTIFSYIDYMSYFDTDIAKDRYVDLVFGDSNPEYNDLLFGNEQGMFYGSGYDISNENWAISDLAKAYLESDEVIQSIIDEYTSFIELLIYIEEYKLDIAEEFEDLVYEEISTENDYSSKTVGQMESVIEDYIDMILEEMTSTTGTDYSSYTAFTSDSLVDVINYLFTEGFEDIQEAKEMVEDCFDVEEMVEEMIKNEGYVQD